MKRNREKKFCFRSAVDRQRRTHLLLLSVVVVFAVAWLPLNVFHLVYITSFEDCSPNIHIRFRDPANKPWPIGGIFQP